MTALFVPYGTPLPQDLTGVRVVGINMSNPPWKKDLPVGIKLITTADVPKHKMGTITPTPEHAWGLIMAAHRRLVGAAQDSFGDRDRWLAPYQLSGRTLGILGFGRIGSAVGRVGRAFGMRVDWTDPVNPKLGCDVMLAESDVVVISCTLTDETRGLLVGKLRLMKSDAILVSIAPWEIFDPIEVVDALAGNTLRAAAFDDWPQDYNSTKVQLLRSLGRLTITPHIAGSTLDARKATEQFVREEMATWLAASA